MSLTENGAKSIDFSNFNSGRIGLFFKGIRDINSKFLITLLNESWDESPSDTLKLMFYIRDTRGGRGERDVFIRCMKWLRMKHPEIFYKYLFETPEYGRYLDLFELCDEEETKRIVIEKLAQQLQNEKDTKKYSLLAKWIPTENCKFDRLYNITNLLAKQLGINKKTLRKEYLTPIRKQLKIVESIIPNWGEINYSGVPSVCMKNLRSAFSRNDNERFMEYLYNSKSKMNVSQLFPYQIVEKYIQKPSLDLTLEKMWKETVKKIREIGSLTNFITVCDVSGSMFGIPLANSIALGLLTAKINEGAFANKIITFSENPTLFTIKGDTLTEKIQHLLNAPWGINTDFQKTIDLILTTMKKNDITQQMTLLILSDMQFDTAGKYTNHHLMLNKYTEAGVPFPKIIYWNLRGGTIDFPTEITNGVALISGFSSSILNTLTECGEINPYMILRTVLDTPRYSQFIENSFL